MILPGRRAAGYPGKERKEQRNEDRPQRIRRPPQQLGERQPRRVHLRGQGVRRAEHVRHPHPRFEDGGNVSKLVIRDAEGRDVYAWDRGPYYGETVPHYADIANEIVAALEAEFCEEA